jgi:anti-sigma B factor antagonist
MPASVETLHAGDSHVVVRLRGELSIEGVRTVELKFTASTASRRVHAIVDMSEVSFVASLGMGMLLQVARALASGKHRMVLVAPQQAVATALRTAKLDMVMPIASDLAAARGAVGVSAPSP